MSSEAQHSPSADNIGETILDPLRHAEQGAELRQYLLGQKSLQDSFQRIGILTNFLQIRFKIQEMYEHGRGRIGALSQSGAWEVYATDVASCQPTVRWRFAVEERLTYADVAEHIAQDALAVAQGSIRQRVFGSLSDMADALGKLSDSPDDIKWQHEDCDPVYEEVFRTDFRRNIVKNPCHAGDSPLMQIHRVVRRLEDALRVVFNDVQTDLHRDFPRKIVLLDDPEDRWAAELSYIRKRPLKDALLRELWGEYLPQRVRLTEYRPGKLSTPHEIVECELNTVDGRFVQAEVDRLRGELDEELENPRQRIELYINTPNACDWAEVVARVRPLDQ